jgi:hypothetical protein
MCNWNRVVPTAMLTLAVMLSISVHEAASQSRTNKIAVPKGAKVQVNGQTARIRSGGITGSWSCDCDGKGTCTIVNSGDGMTCYKGNSGTCTGSCFFTTEQTGISPQRIQ